MKDWISTVARLAAAVEDGVDRARHEVRTRVLGPGRVRVVPYRGYGTERTLHVRGRVLRDPPLPPSGESATVWENLLETYRRFESDEVPRARLRVTFGRSSAEVVTDDEGYYRCALAVTGAMPRTTSWHDVGVELLSPRPDGGAPATAVSPVLVPALGAAFGVISDIDDTVVRTNATDYVAMAREIFLGNARTRLPFEGVAAFYLALHRGPAGTGSNPLFYVSSGPWNLYDLLQEFFELQRIPHGPLILRDWGLTADGLLPTRHHEHKLAAIAHILETYPDLPFILIGDSGQADPEIYAQVIREHTTRIHAAYIRNVSRAEQRLGAIRRLGEEVATAGGTLLVVDDTIAAARHAAERGWIARTALPGIGAAAAGDRTP